MVKGQTRTNSYISDSGGLFWHKSTVTVSTFGYGVPKITGLSGNVNSFTDYKLKVGNEYYYRIKVIYENGKISGFSSEINVKF